MVDANCRVHLGKFQLGESWQLYLSPGEYWCIELTADKDWSWCSDKESGAERVVAALHREIIITNTEISIKPGDEIVWIKASAPDATMWEKCLR